MYINLNKKGKKKYTKTTAKKGNRISCRIASFSFPKTLLLLLCEVNWVCGKRMKVLFECFVYDPYRKNVPPIHDEDYSKGINKKFQSISIH